MKNKDTEENYPLVLTAEEISNILKISKSNAYEMMNQPGFPILKLGRCKRVFRDEFFSWLRKEDFM
jgi:predicted DNA-binding transcriptional regulator AlpA